MTAPYETVCECGRSILRPPRPEIRPRRCEACEQAARQDAARAQLSLFAADRDGRGGGHPGAGALTVP
jgi:hypothetical protein